MSSPPFPVRNTRKLQKVMMAVILEGQARLGGNNNNKKENKKMRMVTALLDNVLRIKHF